MSLDQITTLTPDVTRLAFPTYAALRAHLRRRGVSSPRNLGCVIVTTQAGAKLEPVTVEAQAVFEQAERPAVIADTAAPVMSAEDAQLERRYAGPVESRDPLPVTQEAAAPKAKRPAKPAVKRSPTPKAKAKTRATSSAASSNTGEAKARKRADKPSATAKRYIDKCLRKHGVSVNELVEMTGRPKTSPWLANLKVMAARWGYIVTQKVREEGQPDAGRVAYYMVASDSAAE